MSGRAPRVGALLLAGALGAGCATSGQETVGRTGIGPTARELFVARSVMAYGREPSFDETRRWQDRMDDRVSRYLREHPEIEQSDRYSDFSFFRQVTPGSTRGEVQALLDEPDERTIDAALMAVLAGRNCRPPGKAKAPGYNRGLSLLRRPAVSRYAPGSPRILTPFRARSSAAGTSPRRTHDR